MVNMSYSGYHAKDNPLEKEKQVQAGLSS